MTYLPSMPNGSLIDMIMKYPQYSAPLHRFLEAALREPNGMLDPAQRELVFAYVSGLNGCKFCHAAHRGVAEALGVEPGTIDRYLGDPSLGGCDPKLKPILEFAAALTLDLPAVTRGHFDAMSAVGWDEDTMVNVTMICAAANFFNRWVEGCGVKADPKTVAMGIKALVKDGYGPLAAMG